MQLDAFYSGRASGLPFFLVEGLRSALAHLADRVATTCVRWAIAEAGPYTTVQSGTVVRYPNLIVLGTGVRIGRRCQLTSELPTGFLHIGDGAQINSDCFIDFTGGVSIGRNVVISSRTVLYSHSHGHNPHSPATGVPKSIGDNAWIGTNAVILESAREIGAGSIVAAGSVVTRDVAPYTVVAGNPAKAIRELARAI